MRPHARKRSLRGRAASSSREKTRPGDRRPNSRGRRAGDLSDRPRRGPERLESRGQRAAAERAHGNRRRMARGSRRLANAASARAGRLRGGTTDALADVSRFLEAQPWESLEPHVLKAGANPHEVIPKLRRYAELVIAWNRSVSNLISKNDEARIVSRHLAESLEPAHLLKSSGARRWIDFVSGAGLPAVPLSIAGIGESWALVESRRPKTIFLRRLMMELGLRGINTVHGRLESLTEDQSFVSAFDGVTSRATLALGPTLALAARFVPAGGVAFLWKGSGREREMLEDTSWRKWWDFDGLMGAGGGNITVARFIRT